MSKPICVVYLPSNMNTGGREIDWSDCRAAQENFEKTKPDYHWFVLIDEDATRVELKVFYEKDFTEIQYQELKNLIEEKTKQIQSKVNDRPI